MKRILFFKTNGDIIEFAAVPRRRGPAKRIAFRKNGGIIEFEKFNPNHDRRGRFASAGGAGRRSKYAPSPQRKESGIQLKPKIYAKLCGTLGTRFPGLEEGEIRIIRDAKFEYKVKADGYGGFELLGKRKI